MEVIKEKFAQALGKPVEILNEALEDAYNFEFERLKEFGILVRKINSYIQVTFKGESYEISLHKDDIKHCLEFIMKKWK